MDGIELITAALAAGATAGLTDTTSAAIRDAYGALRERLTALLAGRNAEEALQELESGADPAAIAEEVGADLVESGAVADEQVLDAARRLLALLGPATGTGTGGATGIGAGTGSTFVVGTNHGAVGEFHAPVTFQAPLPPS
ncbi:hypothetical protein AB0M02_25015 [Actinoplanes sp. NPDC051861]|uniref:hypothetical protein n=1 Tax=Actinoplanes sp. NPDC051861 TaxID=3155170 RepID=UPI00341440E8